MKKMKHVITLLLFCLGTIAFAQDAGGHHHKRAERADQIRAQKVAYITEKVGLTSAEAEKFWPLHTEMQQKKKELKKEERQLRKQVHSTGVDNLSDKEVLSIIDRILDIEQQMLDVKKSYNKKFLSVLTPKKLAKFYAAEKSFNRRVAHEVHNRHNGGHRGHRGR